MSIRHPGSGLTNLIVGMRQYFSDQGYSAPIHFGLRAYFEQWNQGPGGASRVVVIPGEFHGEREYRARAYGNLQVKLGHASIDPAEVAQWTRPITISVWAGPDLREPQNELLQNEQTETLFEQVRVAGQVAGMADLLWGDVERVAPPQEGAFGEAILVHLVQRGPLYYPVLDKLFPSAAVGRQPAV